MGLGAHTGDAKLHERSAVQANYQDVYALIQGVWEQFIVKELLAMFNANDIVCSELKGSNDMHDDPQVRANDLAQLTLENGEDLVVCHVSAQFAGVSPAPTAVRSIGADNVAVFSALGYAPKAIAVLTR